MEDDKKRLLSSILDFLKNELKADYLNAENVEGLEVAIQCLESIYNVPPTPQGEPKLVEIYQNYLGSTILSLPDATEEQKREAEHLKTEGNSAMNAHRFNDALELYSKAIQLNGKNAVYYCNRAAAYSKLNDHKSAIKDCKIAIEIDPQYSKAYGRLGLAYTGLEDYERALVNYKMAAELDPTNEGYKNNVSLAERKCAEGRQSGAGIHNANGPANTPDGNIFFGNPHLITIASQMLSDPTMQNMMSTIMAGTLGQDSGMEALLQAGQQLAQQMQAENPGLVDQLRQTLGSVETLRTSRTEDQESHEGSPGSQDSGSKSDSNRSPEKH